MSPATKFLALFIPLLLLAALGATPGAGQTIPARAIYAPLILVAGATPLPATPTTQPPTLTPTTTATAQPTAVVDCPCDQGDVRNCPDFDTQAEAQACYEFCLGETGTDVHQLDTDKDSAACESLPLGWKIVR